MQYMQIYKNLQDLITVTVCRISFAKVQVCVGSDLKDPVEGLELSVATSGSSYQEAERTKMDQETKSRQWCRLWLSWRNKPSYPFLLYSIHTARLLVGTTHIQRESCAISKSLRPQQNYVGPIYLGISCSNCHNS